MLLALFDVSAALPWWFFGVYGYFSILGARHQLQNLGIDEREFYRALYGAE
jgi:hypothetical protein